MRLAAPWYLHPAEHPDAWRRLCAGELGLAFAVINADNGPGRAPDPYYVDALADGCRTPLVGYVFAGYGRRNSRDLRAEARRWNEFYGITDVLIDGVPPAPLGQWELGVIDQFRADGATRVIVNPGMAADPDLVEEADLTCVAEYSWEDYRRLPWTPLPGPWRPERIWHLVHSVPLADLDAAASEVDARGAGFGWVTDATLPNPWGRLPGRPAPGAPR